MTIDIGFNDPIKIQWNTDNEGNKISVEMQPESHTVANGRITLIQIPDEFKRVEIDKYLDPEDENTQVNDKDYYEIHDTRTPIEENNFRVDYQNGIIMFHSSLEGQEITITKYFGRGIILTPASRIYNQIDNEGNVVQTLGQILESQVRNFVFSTEEPPEDPSAYPDGSVWFVYEE